MSGAEEKIKGFLKEIKSNQKKLKVQISVVLKKIEDYILINKPTLKENDIKLLLLGDYEEEQKGLLHLCGTKGRGVKQKLKKSAFYALRILLKFLTESDQKEEFATFFTDLEDDEFPLLKLGLHISLIDQSGDETSLHVCRIIYERRRFLNLDVYIENRNSQIKFAEWYEQNKKDAKAKQAEEPETWEQEVGRGGDDHNLDYVEPEAAQKFASLTQKRRQNLHEFDELSFERDHDFFMKTFQDPMVTKQQADEYAFAIAFKGKKQKKKKKGKKDVDIPFIADRDTAEYKGIIEQIHIDSDHFDPFVLLETFHSETAEFLMNQAIEKVEQDIVFQMEYKKGLLIFYINEFAKCERILSKVQETFLVPESSLSKGRTSDILEHLEGVHGKLMKIAAPILEPKRLADRVRTCLFIYDKLSHIVNWPVELKGALTKKALGPVIKNYESNINCLKEIAELPVFQEVNKEIDKLTRELHKQILTGITIKEKKASNIVDAIRNLYITGYPNDPIEAALQKLFEEIGSFISNYFSSASSSVPKENVDMYTNRKSVYMQSIQNLEAEETTSYDYKSLADLYEDGDGLTEYLDNYVEAHDEKRIKKFYFQKKNLENFIHDFLDSADLFYAILTAIDEGDIRPNLFVADPKIQNSEQKAASQCQQAINDIWNSLFNNLQSYVDYSAKLLNTRKRSVKKALHNDLLALGKSLAKVEEYMMDRQIKREEFRTLKLKTIEIFLREIHNTFINEELMTIKYKENSFLIQDFEQNPFSEFMNDVTAVLERNISEIQNLSVFRGFEPAKGKILANYFASIFINFIKVMKKKLVDEDAKQGVTVQTNSINILLALSNLKYMTDFYFEQMANKYCLDLNIYEEKDFKEIFITKLRAFFPDQIKELKTMYVQNKKEIIKEIFQESLLSEFLDKRKGKYILESKFTESYKQLVLSDKDFPQIRYYVCDVLLQLVMAYDELINYAAFTQIDLLKIIVEETCSVYANAAKLVVSFSKNIDEFKQLWYEIEFFENVTAKFQTERSQAHLKATYQGLLNSKAAVEKIEPKDAEMFDASEIANKKILIVKTKFKYQKQFEVLFM